LDASMALSRDLAQRGFFPAIDALKSSSSNLGERIVGKRHYDVSQKLISLFSKYNSLKRIVQVVGIEELPKADQVDYKRAEKLINFMTQPFSVAEPFTGIAGAYVPTEDSMEDVERVIAGDYDKLTAKDFYMIGRAPKKKLKK
jgi:F-type H+/Na+-transporting ATPase subunit beta